MKQLLIQVRSKTDSWGGSRYAPFHLVDPSLRVRPFSCARGKFWGFSYAFFPEACTRCTRHMTLFIRETLSRVSVASSRPLPLGLVGETRTTATAVRACTSATVPVTLSIYMTTCYTAHSPGPGTPPTSCRRSAMAAPCSRLRRRAM